MVKMRVPTWEFMQQLKTRTSLKTLKEIQDDPIFDTYSQPVLSIIAQAYLDNSGHQDNPFDPIVRKWENAEFRRFNTNLTLKVKAMRTRSGHSLWSKLKNFDDLSELVMIKKITASWFKISKSCFDNGPNLVCHPKIIEEAVYENQPVDPSKYDESPTSPPNEPEDEFHVINSGPMYPIMEEDEEEMEIIEIVAVNE